MQYTFAAVFALLAVSVSAAPTAPAKRSFPSVTFSLTDDSTGQNAAVTILADGNPNEIGNGHLFENTSVNVKAINDEILATSAQLTAFPQGVECVIQFDGETIFELSDEQTFVKLVQDINIPLRLSGDILVCEV